MLININQQNPQQRLIQKVVDILKSGGDRCLSNRYLLWDRLRYHEQKGH